MKHTLLTGIALIGCLLSYAGQFPAPLFYNFEYMQRSFDHTQFFARDSQVFVLRSRGLEILNKETRQLDYKWAGHYPLLSILPDSGNTYVFLKDSSKYIGRYNHLTSQYENIADSTFQVLPFVKQIGISPDFKVWAIASNKLGIYDGTGWQWQTFAGISSFDNLIVAGDTTAYLQVVNTAKIYRYTNGNLNLIFHYASTATVYDWAPQNVDNIWLAMQDSMVVVQSNNSVVHFDHNNTPVTGTAFYHLEITAGGHVLTGVSGTIYDYDGSMWNTYHLPNYVYLKDFTVDNHDTLNVITTRNNYMGMDSLYVWNGTGWTTSGLRFYPFDNAKAIRNDYYNGSAIATDQGIFSFSNLQYAFNPDKFSDSSTAPYANDVTCFVVTDGINTPHPGWGTHHGVFGIPVNNDSLPDSTITGIYLRSNTYYVGTNKGLCIYDGTGYVTFDTSNSPLPSQVITFLTIDNNARLYVGTDKGMAIYTNHQWQVFDTSNVPVSSFYVTGILPSGFLWNDTSIWVSTMGSGLMQVNFDGTYKLMNTQNGQFEDDSLYYVQYMELGTCGSWIMVGTKHNGIAETPAYSLPFVFDYVRSSPQYPGSDSITKSPIIAGNGKWSFFIYTDAGIFWATGCGAVDEISNNADALKWYTEGGELSALTPDDFTGKGRLILTDILGRNIYGNDVQLQPGQYVGLDVKGLPKGFYVLQLGTADKHAVAKVVLR